ncbi:hypothetical protein UP09_18585 [Bradyrhizobium sp. LTSP885]|uniref:hypothetical protein n=1 Tax=Bradyrhizobium sp. LTSP885 TaxID=1619232 RepID=UPI0005E6AB77|nr:hypothetical protein [Bradyrhizobium sp. LTSP885]KJC42506.1 hypothetical protein UP09_18585 [Bradyrhizobium sp. LTSP885]
MFELEESLTAKTAMTNRSDIFLLLAIAGFGCLVGSIFIVTTNQSFFYQAFTPEAVMWACHHGFVYPIDKPQVLLDFLSGQLSDFSCQALNSVSQTQEPGLFARLQLYLTVSVAIAWRLLGVSYANLWPVYAVLHGAYAAGCFALLRAFFGRRVAAAAALALSISPVVIGMLFMLRDYSKAPFVIWAIVFLILAIRTAASWEAIAASGIAGCILGVGTGFRSDVLILLPVGFVFLGVGVKAAAHGWRTRVSAVAMFGVGCVVFAAPIVGVSFGGGSGMLAMQGATDPFVRFLGIGEAPYGLGWRYSDELTMSTIAADLSRNDPNWGEREGEPIRGVSQSLSRSTDYLFRWAPFFSADFVTHAIKSVLLIGGFEALITPQSLALDPAGSRPLWLAPPIPASLRLLLQLAGAAGLLVLLFRIFAKSPRQAGCIAFLFSFLLAYPAIQFSVRHFFHLEILSWLGMLSLIVVPTEWKAITGVKWRFSMWIIGIALTCSAGYCVLLALQDRVLAQQIAHLLALKREPVVTESERSEGDRVAWRLQIPSRYTDLVSGPIDSLSSRLPEVGIEWDVRAAADRLLITVGGPSCPAGEFAITFTYQKRPEVFQPLDHAFTVTADPTQKTMLVAPAFYRSTQYLSEISVPSSRRSCVLRIERIWGDSPLPSSFTAVLVSDWIRHRLHQTLWK